MTYLVNVQPSNFSFVVQDNETILEAALRCGYFFPHRCLLGVCKTCCGRIISGEIDYAGREILGLTPDEQRAGYVLFCQARPKTDLVIYVENAGALHSVSPAEVVYDVIRCEPLANTIMGIRLQAPVNQRIEYQAGQYIKIIHRDGNMSPLSIACAPADCSMIELHVAYSKNNLMARDILLTIEQTKKLRLRGPYGNSTAAKIFGDQPIIFLARGTGFAPIKSIVEELDKFKKYPPMHLYWSAASSDELYMNELAQRWTVELKNFSYTPVLNRELIQHSILKRYPDLTHYRVLASAPESIVYAALPEFLGAGLKRDHYYSDLFDYNANE
jgi:CDP-4-dehydro-6-deoxyglucose reductase